MGNRELYEATRVQYVQRSQGKPYFSPDEMPETVKNHTFDAAELAELMYQIKHISWDGYMAHAKKLVSRPELAYDHVKGKQKKNSALDQAVRAALSKPQQTEVEKAAE